MSSETPPGARGGPQPRRTGPRRPPASEHGCVTPSPAHRARRNVPAPQHEPNCPNHPNHQTQHCDTDTPATGPAKHGTIWRTAGRQTRTRAPHHRAAEATWGSHGGHRDAPRGTDGALSPAGGVHMKGTGETGRTATEHHEVPDDGLCMQPCQGGAGKRAPNLENVFTAVQPLIITFLSHGGETAHSKSVPCLPHATGTNQHRNKQNTCTQQIRLNKTRNHRQTNQPRGD